MNNSPNNPNQKVITITDDITTQHTMSQQNHSDPTTQTSTPTSKTSTTLKLLLNITLLTIGVFFIVLGITEFINTIYHPTPGTTGFILLPMATFYVILTLSGIIILIKSLTLLFRKKDISPHA